MAILIAGVAAAACGGQSSTPYATQRAVTPSDRRIEETSLVKIPETVLRARALAAPSPQYPAFALARGDQGVAVAELLVAAEGVVRSVKILEAPSEDISASVKEAVARWRFPPVKLMDSGSPKESTGKLTFYFMTTDGNPRVLSPDALALERAAHGAAALNR